MTWEHATKVQKYILDLLADAVTDLVKGGSTTDALGRVVTILVFRLQETDFPEGAPLLAFKQVQKCLDKANDGIDKQIRQMPGLAQEPDRYRLLSGAARRSVKLAIANLFHECYWHNSNESIGSTFFPVPKS